MLPVLLIAVAPAACVGASAAQSPARQTENVVLVTLDGARWQDVFGGMDEGLLRFTADGADVAALPAYRAFTAASAIERREKLMPFLWRTLAANDGFLAGDRTAGSRMAVTNRLWFSYPGYSEILTGQAHDDVIRSNKPIRNPFPSVLEFIKRSRQLTAAQIATFASWNVIAAAVESEKGATTVNAGYHSYAPRGPDSAGIRALDRLQTQSLSPWPGIRHDVFTFRFAMDYLKREKPRVLFISFDETDDWAHDGKYDLVLEMLHRSDGYLAELWKALGADPQYRGKTTLIVTTDHGRGRTSADWRRHGADVPGADEIWMAVASPDTTRRGVWRQAPDLFQNQIAATIADVLGLDYRQQNPQAGHPIGLQ